MRSSDEARPVVVLVDALSTGALLARLVATDHAVVHVRSRLDLPATFAATLPSDLFAADLTYLGDAGEVLERLAALAPVAVIAASEFGVEVADEISAKLGLRGNDPVMSSSRRDKDLMMRALAAAGLRTPRQLCAEDPAELVAWRSAQRLGKVVVKPLDSAGSEDVYTCETDDEVLHAARLVLGKTNLMLRLNESVLVQEFLTGDEFVVNTVSRNGVHWFTDAWLCSKVEVDGRRKIYSYEDLLPADDPRLAEVLPYVADVLDALGIQQGPAHTELIVTEDGPCLLETGARLSGLANPVAVELATGADQIGLTIDCYLRDGTALADRPLRYDRRRFARCMNLIARREVPLPAAALREAAERLPAFESVRFRVREGAITRQTVDLNSSPAAVFLVHEDQREIEQAYRALRALERDLL
ncbi:ATP-grasp domain-containing protein [Micromonospora phytophila]|uniref:ATP-grasp domain-containing protein n=1 Tax=Micromonospora phytophila TaxID=709888 RepID=UPI00202DF60F|nr:ATP-grasp domain-containing protein [Micromonospora phytophila]MCM0675152.1 ATP-grasp domain-containing protein [Micromonospora phytophila]